MMLAPCCASARTIARPMPLLPPVTIATFPLSDTLAKRPFDPLPLLVAMLARVQLGQPAALFFEAGRVPQLAQDQVDARALLGLGTVPVRLRPALLEIVDVPLARVEQCLKLAVQPRLPRLGKGAPGARDGLVDGRQLGALFVVHGRLVAFEDGDVLE